MEIKYSILACNIAHLFYVALTVVGFVVLTHLYLLLALCLYDNDVYVSFNECRALTFTHMHIHICVYTYKNMRLYVHVNVMITVLTVRAKTNNNNKNWTETRQQTRQIIRTTRLEVQQHKAVFIILQLH